MVSINFEDALKAKKLRAYFNEHGRIYIIVDATSDDVMVPDFLKGDPALPLVLNARMPQPIYIRDSFLESNFTFSGVSHHCVIPMNRIWASYLPESDMSSGMVWDEAVPEVVKVMMDDAQSPEQVDVNKKDNEANQQPVQAKVSAGPGKQVGHLRVIK
ncbi:MAG: ClpXP protease specificity-enhancing factor SspB [Ghiorsea sp.]